MGAPSVAFVAPVSARLNVSSPSSFVSPSTFTGIVPEVDPGQIVIEPLAAW